MATAIQISGLTLWLTGALLVVLPVALGILGILAKAFDNMMQKLHDDGKLMPFVGSSVAIGLALVAVGTLLVFVSPSS